ncbi:hypothetical protein [Massilia sp. TSP1-1-2]|uniref:hypothetical protein n=1 Tax=Massilia sp. TSP1-1-2 TaxID=2804649 RepID=UPI003CE8DC28
MLRLPNLFQVAGDKQLGNGQRASGGVRARSQLSELRSQNGIHGPQQSALMYELEDAQEHLTSIIANMNSDANFDEVNLRIDLGHVFSHLNRAWHRREKIEGLDEVEWLEASKFPTDLDPT